MTVTVPLVQASHPEALTQGAATVGAAADDLAARIARQQTTLAGLAAGWQGSASDAAIAEGRRILDRMQAMHQALTGVRAALADGGAALTPLRAAVVGTVARLEGQGWQVAADGTVSVRPGSPLDLFARLGPANAVMIQMLGVRNTLELRKLLAQFDVADQRTDEALRRAVVGLDTGQGTGGGGGPSPPGEEPETKIPDTKDPVAVRDWWTSLTPEQRERLLREHPERIGNLNGIPNAVRSQANVAIRDRDLARVDSVAASHHVGTEEVLAHPERYGLTATDLTRYHNAVEVKKAMDRYGRDAVDADGKTPPILLPKYDPEAFGGKGSAAVAIGDPDLANNTTVKVSGFTTSVKAGSLDNPDPANLYTETAKADPGKSNAVLMWMGYDAPNDQAVVEPNMARNGAQLLAADVNALDATHLGSNHLTVIGHSYGSTTVADAAAGYGMRADDVVLIGSPGTDLARSAADFHLPPDGHLYVGAASTDPVTYFGKEHVDSPGVGLGADPSVDGYGSTRFHAESSEPNFLHDHSRYFQKGSESLFSMADIASGHGNLLSEHGMTADHRADHWYAKVPIGIPGTPLQLPANMTLPGLDQVTDPEWQRQAHDDHRH